MSEGRERGTELASSGKSLEHQVGGSVHSVAKKTQSPEFLQKAMQSRDQMPKLDSVTGTDIGVYDMLGALTQKYLESAQQGFCFPSPSCCSPQGARGRVPLLGPEDTTLLGQLYTYSLQRTHSGVKCCFYRAPWKKAHLLDQVLDQPVSSLKILRVVALQKPRQKLQGEQEAGRRRPPGVTGPSAAAAATECGLPTRSLTKSSQ